MEILYGLAQNDSRITVIHQKNSGVSFSRNIGIDAADGAYITFVDSDDTIENTMYEKMMYQIKSKSADCVICGYKEHKCNGTFVDYHLPYEILLENRDEIIEKFIKPILGFYTANVPIFFSVFVWNKIFSKKIIKDNQIKFNETRALGEDWMFCLEYYSCSNSIYFLDELLNHYIHHGNESLIGKTQFRFLETCFSDRNNFRRLFPELEWNCSPMVDDYIYCPIKAAHYYRTRLKGKVLRGKIKEIYNICKNDKLFCRYVDELGGICKLCFKNATLFRMYILLKSNYKVFKSKVFSLLIKTKKAVFSK